MMLATLSRTAARHFFRSGVALILFTAILAGCSGETPPPAPSGGAGGAAPAASGDAKKAEAKTPGKDKGNIMPEFPKG